MESKHFCLFGSVFLLLLVGVGADPNSADLVENLPGQPPVSFNQYAGYITVNETNGRNLFYWFIESQNDPSSDPVIVWYQGGPGCSSMLALLTENGPFLPDMKNLSRDLVLNNFSWNRFSNILYVDSPAGAGFSYSNTPSDYTTDNNKTAEDNYAFLQLWFAKYSQFASNPLWITGESYSGDYVPQLVYAILTGSDASLKKQLVGFAVGNPVMSCPAWKETHRDVEVEMFYWHGMMPLHLRTEWMNSGCLGTSANPSLECDALYDRILEAVGPFASDDLYLNGCTGNGTLDYEMGKSECVSIDQRRFIYLNSKDVQNAIHAKPTRWVECQNPPVLNYSTNWPDMIPYYQFFFDTAPYLRILIYSGDVDIATVPHSYTQLCLQDMGRRVIEPWRQWKVGKSTAGYVERYNGFTYATLKGAGHEAPEFQPLSAFEMMSRFINGTNF